MKVNCLLESARSTRFLPKYIKINNNNYKSLWFPMKFNLKCANYLNYSTILVVLVLANVFSNESVVVSASPSSSFANKASEQEWKITFYTGSKIWAGTDSIIYVQLHGTTGDSRIIQITPGRLQMEARSIDTFSIGNLEQKQLGTIHGITVSKQHSYAFFNDWELLKVELIDPSDKVYLFNCKCWLTALKYKQRMDLFSIDGQEINKHIRIDSLSELHRKTFRIFPILVTLLFLILLLIGFTYFGNFICKKWRLFNNSKILINCF
jgi:hypothetical protein